MATRRTIETGGGANVMSEGATKDGSRVTERLAFLIGKRVRVRVWWNSEAQAASPAGDLFVATFIDCLPVGRDYFLVFETNGRPRRTIIKSSAVLQIEEVEAA